MLAIDDGGRPVFVRGGGDAPPRGRKRATPSKEGDERAGDGVIDVDGRMTASPKRRRGGGGGVGRSALRSPPGGGVR